MPAGKRLGNRRAHPLRRRARTAGAGRAFPRLAGTRRAAEHAGRRRPPAVPHRKRLLQAADAAADGQPRQLHHQPRQSGRWLGEQAEALGVEIYPGFRRRRSALSRGRFGQGRRHRRSRHRQGRPAQPQLPAGHGAACQADHLRRRLPRFADQAVVRANSTCATASIRKPTASASRSCGKSIRPNTSRG